MTAVLIPLTRITEYNTASSASILELSRFAIKCYALRKRHSLHLDLIHNHGDIGLDNAIEKLGLFQKRHHLMGKQRE